MKRVEATTVKDLWPLLIVWENSDVPMYDPHRYLVCRGNLNTIVMFWAPHWRGGGWPWNGDTAHEFSDLSNPAEALAIWQRLADDAAAVLTEQIL